MKFLASFLLLLVAGMVAVDAFIPPVQRPHVNKPQFPGQPQGPFNPEVPSRFPRSPKEKNGQVSVSVNKQGGKTSWNVEGQHKVWGNKHGSIHVSGGASKQPGSKTQGQVGIGGSFTFG